MSTIQELENFTIQVRRDIVRMVHAVNSGHPGGSLGCTEFLTVLYNNVLEYNKNFNKQTHVKLRVLRILFISILYFIEEYQLEPS